MDHYIQAVSIRWYNACAYYAVALARGLRSLGHRVTFAGAAGTPAVQKAGEYGIDILEGAPYRTKNPVDRMKTISKFRRYALENNVKLVNVHHGSDHVAWSLALAGTGIPLIRTSGNQIPPSANMFARYLMLKKTAGVIASCRTIQGFFSDGFGIPEETIPVINGGIDTGYFLDCNAHGSLRKVIGIPESSFVYGILGRFSPDKGHDFFFRAAGILAKKFPEVRFLVAGWKAQYSENDIRMMAEEAGILDRTVFPGRRNDSRDIIDAIDVGVIASVRSETICRIAMEYQAMGVPVIATDTNVIPEIIRHNESGLVVPAKNPGAMAAAMEQLYISQEKARAMERRGSETTCQNYSLESFASQTIEAYRSCTGNG